MAFELFDPHVEVAIQYGRLPHLYQSGVTYFVTFRTHDSVPQSLARSWHARRATWLRQHGIDPLLPLWRQELRQNTELESAYHNKFTQAFLGYLDRGYSDCVLKDPQLAGIVAESLRHFDGDRYHLGDFVVMPNHVHLLVGLVGMTEIRAQCKSWKTFTAGKINARLGWRGRFWQEESFDHLVRSEAQFERLRSYIAENPKSAGLRDGAFRLHPT
jgi:type I restriction enzyme R subunit